MKNWIPYMYRVRLAQLYKTLPQAEIFEYLKENWTFHAKGIWLYDQQDL